MTDFTLSSGSICRPFRSPWGAFPTRTYTVSTGVSSATIPLGGPVAVDHTLADPTTNAAYVLLSPTAHVPSVYAVGIAAERASGAAAVAGVTAISVWECNPLVEFKAATVGGTLQSSHVGNTKSFYYDSTLQIAIVDLSASTAADNRVVVTQLIDNVGDSGGYVAFRFMTGSHQRQGSTLVSSSPYLAFYR